MIDDDDNAGKAGQSPPHLKNTPDGKARPGYRNPPESGQFKPGNPGRPPGSRNRPKTFAEEIEAALETEIALGGADEVVSARKAIAKKLVRDALVDTPRTTLGFAKIALDSELTERRWKKLYPNGDNTLADILSAALKRNGITT